MKKILQKAKEASLKAYAPYSNFQVGCAFELKDGNYILGANIENVSFGVTCCAERTAIAVATMADVAKDDVIKIGVYNKSQKVISPCGICRQALSEFVNLDIPLIMGNDNKYIETTIEQLLPYTFNNTKLK